MNGDFSSGWIAGPAQVRIGSPESRLVNSGRPLRRSSGKGE
jgi:hypothetical protein